MRWSYDRRTGHVTDEQGRVVADTSPEFGYAIAALPELRQALELLEEWATATLKQLSPTTRPEMLDRVRHARASIAKANEK